MKDRHGDNQFGLQIHKMNTNSQSLKNEEYKNEQFVNTKKQYGTKSLVRFGQDQMRKISYAQEISEDDSMQVEKVGKVKYRDDLSR